MEEEYKGDLLMIWANLEERDQSILKYTLGGKISYERVKMILLNISDSKERKNVWIANTNRSIKCYSCNKTGNIRSVCPENKYRAKGTCECCQKGHVWENCQYNKLRGFKCQKLGHPSFVYEREEKEKGKRKEQQKEELKQRRMCGVYLSRVRRGGEMVSP